MRASRRTRSADRRRRLAPIGTGILLLGGRGNRVENNRIYGNYLGGVAAIDGILLSKNPQAMSLDRNIVQNNAFGLGGTDLNGHDIVYDGSGSDNCFSRRATDTYPAEHVEFAVHRHERVQPVGAQHDAQVDRRERDHRLGQAPAPRQGGLQAAGGFNP